MENQMTTGSETGNFVDSGERFKDRRAMQEAALSRVTLAAVARAQTENVWVTHYTDEATGTDQMAMTD